MPDTAPQLSYADYLRTHPAHAIGSEGDTFTPLDEATWNSMPPRDRYMEMVSGATGNGVAGGDPLEPDSDTSTAFRRQFGNETWTPDASGIPQGMGHLVYGYVGEDGVLRLGMNRDAPGEWAIDPSRIMYLPDGRWVMEQSNIRGQWLEQAQATDDRLANQHMTRGAVVVATLAAGAIAFNGGLGAVAADASGAGLTATGTAGVGAGATGSAGLSTGIAGAATVPGDIITPAASTVNPALADIPQISTTGIIPPAASVPAQTPAFGTQAPAPVTTATTLPATSSQPGLIQRGINAVNGMGNWYNGLSPAARTVVNAGVSAGVQGLAGANAQRAASQEADRLEEQARQDRIRRTNVTPYMPSAFTPKPAGIIGSAFTPKPGG